MELKIGQVGDKLLLGAAYIELEDETDHTYQATNFADFVNYLDAEKCIVFLNHNQLESYKKEQLNEPYYNMAPIAKCTMVYHPILTALLNVNKKVLSLVDFSDSLQTLKKYLLEESLPLFDICSNLKITKVVSIERDTDRRGNFVYSVKAEKGKQDYEFPETIKFGCPIFDDNSGRIELEFNLNFTWDLNSEGKVEMKFKLINLEVETLIKEEITKLYKETFEKAGIQKFFGSLSISKATNRNMFEVTKVGNVQ